MTGDFSASLAETDGLEDFHVIDVKGAYGIPPFFSPGKQFPVRR
jgi:hypothetical protein